jgi:hypothetical protein
VQADEERRVVRLLERAQNAYRDEQPERHSAQTRPQNNAVLLPPKPGDFLDDSA